jgi:hypothetical protein
LFVCAPSEDFPTDDDIGKGLLMKTGAQNAWFPGNYGFLDLGPGNPGVVDALLGHGLNGCQKIDESNTEPGNKNATDAINTRFDIYAGLGATNDPSACSDTADGTSCPDRDVGKDLSMQMTYEFSQNKNLPAPTSSGTCDSVATGNQGNPNPKITFTPFALDSNTKGMPRDTCHYTGSCADGNFGDKVWNRDAYFLANYGWDSATWPTQSGLPSDATRYDVYKWETTASPSKLVAYQVGADTHPATNPKITGQTATYSTTRTCAYRKPRQAKGPADEGRRILPVVAANCESLNGKENLDEFHAIRVFNVFLTEPSMNRAVPGTTDDKEIYGEIVGPAETVAGGTGFQYYSRNRPYLVR